MIRKLLYTIIWAYVFSFGAALLFGLAGPFFFPKPVGAQAGDQAFQAAARMSLGVPGVGGFVGVAFGLLGLLPGTSIRRAFRHSKRPLLRKVDPGLYTLRLFLDGEYRPPADSEGSDLPKIAFLTVGIIAILLGVTGVLYGLAAALQTGIPSHVSDVFSFRIALYTICLLCIAFCGVLLSCGVEFVQVRTRKVWLFGTVMLLEVLYLALSWFLLRVLFWLIPEVGTSVAAAMEAANSALMFQAVVLFPLWAPFLALWATYHLAPESLSDGSGAAVTTAKRSVDRATAIRALQARCQNVRRMYNGFDYKALLGVARSRQKAGVDQAMRFIRSLPDGQSRYMQALTDLSRAFAQAMPAYEAELLREEVTFFQAVRTAMLASTGDVPAVANVVEDGVSDVPPIPEAVILEPAAPAIAEPVILEPAERRVPGGAIVEPTKRPTLCEDEADFYNALDVEDAEVELLGVPTLLTIARELAAAVRRNVTVDWSLRKNAKGEMRLMAKRILKKHGYPPHKQENVAQFVLARAEEVCRESGG